jgi:hypothetical protein
MVASKTTATTTTQAEQLQGQQQIPPLRCGMTTKKTGNSKGKSRGNGNGNGKSKNAGFFVALRMTSVGGMTGVGG